MRRKGGREKGRHTEGKEETEGEEMEELEKK